MDQQVKDRLDGLDEKLDKVLAVAERVEATVQGFLNGPGKSIGRLFGKLGG